MKLPPRRDSTDRYATGAVKWTVEDDENQNTDSSNLLSLCQSAGPMLSLSRLYKNVLDLQNTQATILDRDVLASDRHRVFLIRQDCVCGLSQGRCMSCERISLLDLYSGERKQKQCEICFQTNDTKTMLWRELTCCGAISKAFQALSSLLKGNTYVQQ